MGFDSSIRQKVVSLRLDSACHGESVEPSHSAGSSERGSGLAGLGFREESCVYFWCLSKAPSVGISSPSPPRTKRLWQFSPASPAVSFPSARSAFLWLTQYDGRPAGGVRRAPGCALWRFLIVRGSHQGLRGVAESSALSPRGYREIEKSGGLAQLGEHDVRNVGVGGSNPLPSTIPRLA